MQLVPIMQHLQAVIAQHINSVGRKRYAVFVYQTLTGMEMPTDGVSEEVNYESLIDDMKDMLLTISIPKWLSNSAMRTLIQATVRTQNDHHTTRISSGFLGR